MDALGGACGVDDRSDGQRGSEFWFEARTGSDQMQSMTALAISKHTEIIRAFLIWLSSVLSISLLNFDELRKIEVSFYILHA